MRLTLIGAGVMGTAFARAWRARIKKIHLTIYDADPKKRGRIKRIAHARATHDIPHAVKNAHVIFLAVKPQLMHSVLTSLKPAITSSQLIISIAAGISLRTLARALPARQPIVRAMPNLPLTEDAGVTAWCANNNVVKTQLKNAKTLLSTGAHILRLPERHMNAVTAVSGSGPGYVFFFADALVKAARVLGLSPRDADMLVRTTLLGAGIMLARSTLAPSALVSKVASKGGTTEAALHVFQQKKLAALIQAAVRAAHRRAEHLSR